MTVTEQRHRRPTSTGQKKKCTVLGLVGGVGSGKSTVARLFEEWGAEVIDADAICAELHRTPEVREAIEAEWGRDVYAEDGQLDRARLANIVFDRPDDLKKLNAILHPRVTERVERSITACRTDGGPPLCVIDAPLLLETGLDRLCDTVAFIDCDRATRSCRLARERHWPPDEIERREAHQTSIEEKRKRADVTICNQGDLRTTCRIVRNVAQALTDTGE